MDSDRFDAITQRLANATSRRGAFRALVAAAAAAVGARVGLDAEAAKNKKDKKGKDNDRCVDLGGKCGGKPKKGKKPPKCCGDGQCKGGRCACPSGKKECNGKCIKNNACCTNKDCGPCQSCKKNGTCSANCGANETCNDQSDICECNAPFTACGAACIDTSIDANNCGACNNACDNGESCVAGECVVVVTTDEKGWVFFDNTTLPGSPKTNGTVEFVAGPGTAPIGSGSAEFKTTLGSDKATLSNPSFDGMALADITEFRYSTYSHPGSGHIVPAVKLEIEYDFNGGKDTAHLIFEPVYYGSGPNPVVEGQWQTWNLIGPDAEWWAFNSSASPQANYVSWAEMLNRHPGAVITGDYEGKFLHLETGSGTANKTGNADKLVVNGTIYDFEPAASGANAARKKDKKREGR